LEAVRSADVVIIAVKPKQTKDVLEEIKPELVVGKHIVVSVVTGVSLAEMQAVVGNILERDQTTGIDIQLCRYWN
jgi:pyrroline-5-carboxylate reductase